MKDSNQKGRAIVYTRWSPRPDAADCTSSAFQLGECREYADAHGWTVARTFDDPDRSGKDEYREVLWSAIDALKKGDVLLVYKRDRLARNVYLAEQINRAVEKKGGRIVAVSGDVEGDTPEARMVRQIIASVAEYERKLIAARVSAAMRHYQADGRRMGGTIPYGYSIDPDDPSRIVPNAAEQDTIAKIKEMAEWGRNMNEIARRLPPETARTGRWHPEKVRRILARV